MTNPVSAAPRGECIGLVGGLGVAAIVHYCKELVREHAVRGLQPNLDDARVRIVGIMRRVLGTL